jgi:hypothetical protein
MVAFVLWTIVTFVFWSLAVGNYRSEHPTFTIAREAGPQLTEPQPTLAPHDRAEASVAGVIGGILILVVALTIFIWSWRNGVFIHPGTVLFITVYTLISLVVVCAFALESVFALPEFFPITLYTLQSAPVAVLIYLGVVAAIWAGAIGMQRLEDQLFSNSKNFN